MLWSDSGRSEASGGRNLTVDGSLNVTSRGEGFPFPLDKWVNSSSQPGVTKVNDETRAAMIGAVRDNVGVT